MATNLLEAYKKRLAVAESVHQRTHNGAKMSPQKKLLVATCLNNISKFINEAFDHQAPTQRSALGDYKKFCLNVANVSLPNLILPELMLTQPMTSFTGFVTYLRYVAGTAKGGVKVGDMFNSVYSLGEMTPERERYTSSAVSEEFTSGISASDDIKVNLHWTPVASVHSVIAIDSEGKEKILEADNYSFTKAGLAGESAPYVSIQEQHNQEGMTGLTTDGELKLDLSSTGLSDVEKVKVLYFYNNVEIPQKVEPTSLPTLKAQMTAISLRAHARRIAIYYSQISAFQAKQDYGFDLGDQLAQQAQGELAYEIDSEGVRLLVDGAEEDSRLNFDVYEQTTLQGISMSQYYEGFNQVVNIAKAIIYQRTQKFSPNYMIVGSNVLTILPFINGWNAAPMGVVNGPYFAGTFNGLKVYVSPAIDPNEYVFGINGSDLQTSAAVYAPLNCYAIAA